MDKQTQDQLWNELSEESKEEIRNNYKKAFEENFNFFALEYQILMRDKYGSHNLEPEPPTPKTWEDVEKENEVIKNIFKNLEFHIHRDLPYKEHDLIRSKMLATYQIQQIIDLGYGGMMSEQEWEDPSEKYVVGCFDGKIKGAIKIGHYHFIAFHTPAQRDEFMSHESNRKLVEQYFMM